MEEVRETTNRIFCRQNQNDAKMITDGAILIWQNYTIFIPIKAMCNQAVIHLIISIKSIWTGTFVSGRDYN